MNENLIENSKVMGDYLKDEFKSLQKEFPVIGDVRGRGLMLGLELVKDQKSKEPAASEAALLMELSKGEGLLIGKGGLYGNVIRIAPSLGITKTEAEELVSKLRTSFQKLK
jgi:4-aminobutyrate aminotransferase-like enzyme